jgi:hypothetical protein
MLYRLSVFWLLMVPIDMHASVNQSHVFSTDNPINQTILVTFMKKKKIKYDVAKNGLEAVQKWKTGGFHLILVSNMIRHHSCKP